MCAANTQPSSPIAASASIHLHPPGHKARAMAHLVTDRSCIAAGCCAVWWAREPQRQPTIAVSVACHALHKRDLLPNGIYVLRLWRVAIAYSTSWSARASHQSGFARIIIGHCNCVWCVWQLSKENTIWVPFYKWVVVIWNNLNCMRSTCRSNRIRLA